MARKEVIPKIESNRAITRILQPIQDFIHRSAAGGIVLFGATILALLLANIPALADVYRTVLETKVGLTYGPDNTPIISETVLHWINDGLMAIFFLLVGLEIKREVRVGELTNPRAAMLPIAAAVGGVVVPALIYIAFNAGRPGATGWGVPMATDIAFALGALAVLGTRVPFTLKVFLTAVAIVDDLIAVLVIALFYSGGLNLTALTLGALILALLTLANQLGVRALWFYLGLGVLLWWAFLESGIHATIAGVLLALTIPARYEIDERTFLERARDILTQFDLSEFASTRMITDERQQSAVLALEDAAERVQAPLQKLEHSLHMPVMFLIVPIFALANAGVVLSFAGIEGDALRVVLGILFGLVIGKPVGIVGAAWLAVKAGWASLPVGVTWHHLTGAGILAGIGFTMSLFIASLGFGEGSELLEAAKLGILAASAIAGATGLLVLRSARTAKEPRPTHVEATG
ncbi:MAG: Na+/H+ antiporter NhaA [Chloroflexota bacterium]|nr:Na+/H+ antiporter NhaA [Chloroflexota bacterium]